MKKGFAVDKNVGYIKKFRNGFFSIRNDPFVGADKKSRNSFHKWIN